MKNKPIIITISNFNGKELDYIVQPDATMDIAQEFNEDMKLIGIDIHVDALDNPKGIIEIKGN